MMRVPQHARYHDLTVLSFLPPLLPPENYDSHCGAQKHPDLDHGVPKRATWGVLISRLKPGFFGGNHRQKFATLDLWALFDSLILPEISAQACNDLQCVSICPFPHLQRHVHGSFWIAFLVQSHFCFFWVKHGGKYLGANDIIGPKKNAPPIQLSHDHTGAARRDNWYIVAPCLTDCCHQLRRVWENDLQCKAAKRSLFLVLSLHEGGQNEGVNTYIFYHSGVLLPYVTIFWGD